MLRAFPQPSRLLAFCFRAAGVTAGLSRQYLGPMPGDGPELPEGPPFLAGCWTLAIFARGCWWGQFHPLLSPGLQLQPPRSPQQPAGLSPQHRFLPQAQLHQLLLSGASRPARSQALSPSADPRSPSQEQGPASGSPSAAALASSSQHPLPTLC